MPVLSKVFLLCIMAHSVAAQATRDQEIVRGLDQAQAQRELNLSGYSVTERYTVQNSRFGTQAEMVIEAVFGRGVGKTYRVVSRSGSALLQTRVLEKLLKEEADMSHGAAWQQTRVISANYKVRLVGEDVVRGRRCDVLELIPRVNGPHVLRGRAWVDIKDFSLVRLEGRPGSSPSFLAGRPEIVRDYQNIDGFAFASWSHAVSTSIFVGKTELTIDYKNYQLRGR